MPKEWRRSLGYIPEKSQLANLEESLLEVTRKREEKVNQSKETSFSMKTALAKEVQSELDDSFKFEERLRTALSQKSCKENVDSSPRRRLAGGDAPTTTYVYSPVSSCLSPTLAMLSSPLSSHLRLRRRRRADDGRVQSFNVTKEEEKAVKRVKVGVLTEKIERDLDESYYFEQRLKSALGQK